MRASGRGAFLCALLSCLPAAGDALDDIRARGSLIWGGDQEGGGPYVYPDPADPARVTGFEVELGALLARELGVEARFSQGQWDNLPALLESGRIDIVLNGYELTAARAARMGFARAYYIYELVLLGRRGDPALRSWEDLRSRPRKERARVGALVASSAHSFLEERWADRVEVVVYDGNTDAMRDVETGKLDATLQDLPFAMFYRDRYPGLAPVGEPVGRGHYVLYYRKGQERLGAALDAALTKAIASGELKSILERYGIWSQVQEELGVLDRGALLALVGGAELRGWAALRGRVGLLIESAWMTVKLALVSMPLAILLGLLLALGRLYGPSPLKWLVVAWVELLRGTPLMLQLFVIFFLLPEIGIPLPPFVAAVLGLGINYSAYEAEIYRAGIQAIPRGQMEAALALGMSRGLALRRVVLPQAARIALPPVTNDFIALFKDTSVCSVITVVELTKRYNIERTVTGATLELAALTALLYLLMSVPLSRLALSLEKRLGRGGGETVASPRTGGRMTAEA